MESRKKTRGISLLPVLAGLMVVIPFLLAAGCTENCPEPADHPLEGIRWELTEYVYNGTSQHILPGTTVTLYFVKGGGVSGQAGCNSYSGYYTLNDTTITIDHLGHTEMACPDSRVMDLERCYLSLLSDAVSLTVGNDTLSFADSHGNTILSFETGVLPEPVSFVGKNWTLYSFYTPDAVTPVINGTTITVVFENEGHFTGSAGCNQYYGSYTVTGVWLLLHNISSTRMNCPGPGIMEQEATYLEYLGNVTGRRTERDCLRLTDDDRRTYLLFTAEP